MLARFCSFSRRRFSSFMRFTSARTSALLRASSAYTMKSCPSSFTHCWLSAVRTTKTTPSSPTGTSMVHADQPGAPSTGSISVSHDAPPVPHELAGVDFHPCGGCFHSPAGSDCVAQCSTVSWSERSITIVCSAPDAARRASTTISFTAPSPMLSSLRQYNGAPPARCSHRRAMSEGESSVAAAAAAVGAAGGVETMELAAAGGSFAAAGMGGGDGATGGGGGGADAPVFAASIAVFFTRPGGRPYSRSSASMVSPASSRLLMTFTAPA